MSFFYMSPAKGDIPVHILETIINNRLIYLDRLFKSQLPHYNEYLVEGSVYDNVGHYILCVLAILDQSSHFTHYVLKAEKHLFGYRLNSISAYDLRILAKQILKSTKKDHSDAEYIEPLKKLCQHFIIKHIAYHVTSICTQTCNLYMIEIKFNHCLKLIAKRHVELRRGKAILPCSMWKSYFITLFNENLKNRLYNTKLKSIINDPRMKDIQEKFRDRFEPSNHNSVILKSTDVDRLSDYFPPCMKNLHDNLRRKHRLSHHQRFNYSLFLKDIGMPVNEAMRFWQSEYNQEPTGTHVCCHNWQKDEKKYVYGIRHMYGLEGGRKSYSSKTCTYIQNSDNSISEGGCPFKSFDNFNMIKCIGVNENDPKLSTVTELKTERRYTLACSFLLKHKFALKPDCDISNFNFSPVKYFTMATNKL